MDSYVHEVQFCKVDTKLDRQPVKMHQDISRCIILSNSSSCIENSLKTLTFVTESYKQESFSSQGVTSQKRV